MAEHSPRIVSRDEFREELADLLDEDPEALRARAEAIELDPPWEAEVVGAEQTDE